VIEATVAERRTRTQVFRCRDLPDLTRRHEIRIEHQDLGRIYAETHIGPRWSSEPRMPAQTRRPAFV